MHKRVGRFIVLLILGIEIVGCDFWVPRKQPVPRYPEISGALSGLDSDDRAIVEVHSSDASYSTGPLPNGIWSIQGLRDGVYVVRASARGYVVDPSWHTISVKDHEVEQPASLDFIFSRGDVSQPTAAPTVRPPAASPTPIACTQNPPGLVLQAIVSAKPTTTPGASGEDFRIEGKGFIPGEKLLSVIEGHGASHSERLESFDLPAGADGSFVQRESIQLEEPNMSWQVFVVHQRGVACTSFVTTP